MSYQQSRAKAEQSSEDRHWGLRIAQGVAGSGQGSHIQECGKQDEGKCDEQFTHGTMERTLWPRLSGNLEDWPECKRVLELYRQVEMLRIV